MKSNSGAKKRFKITKNGKIKRSSAFKGHILGDKPASRKRRLRKSTLVSSGEADRVKRMLPYN